MDLYREQILEHYRHPLNWGLVQRADIERHGYNPLCGDEVTIQLQINNGMITEVRFEGKGCAVSVAAASLLSEMIQKKSIATIQRLGVVDINLMLGLNLPPARISCGLLALKTVQAALPS